MAKIGERVVVMWGVKNGKNLMAGWGEYLGDIFKDSHPTAPSKDEILKALAEEDSITKEDLKKEASELENLFPEFIEFNMIEKATEEMWLAHLEQINKPQEERIKDMRFMLGKSPCIMLDSGEIVWGFQCYWASESKWFELGYDQLEWVTIKPSEFLTQTSKIFVASCESS